MQAVRPEVDQETSWREQLNKTFWSTMFDRIYQSTLLDAEREAD